jgi:hypothetical protein
MPTGTLPPPPPAEKQSAVERQQPVDAVTIDRGISEQLKRARFHVWVADLVGILALWLAITLTTFILASACEHWIAPFGVLGRTVFLSGLVGSAVYFIGWKLAPLLLRRINNVFAARVIEQHDPTLKNSVVNFLYIKDEIVGSNGGMHEVVVENLRRRAAADLTRVQVDSAIDRTTMFRYAYALAGVVAVLGAYKVLSPKDPFVTVARVLAPWAQIAPPCRVSIVSVKPGDVELTQGEVLPVEVEIEGLRQGEIPRVVYSTADGRLTDQSVPLTPKAGFQFEAKLPATAADDVAQQGLQQDIIYRIEAGDAVGFPYRVKVRSVSTIDVQKVDLAFPDYTGRGRETLERTGDVRAVEGTRVTLYARANRAIRSAEIEFFTPGTIIDESGVRKPAARIPLTVAQAPGESGESDRKSAQVSFVLMLQPDGKPKYDSYQLRFVSEDQQTSSEPVVHQLDVIPDLAPEVEIIRPETGVTEVAIDDSSELDIRGRDPDFGIRRITLKLLRSGKELPVVPLLDDVSGKRDPIVQSWTLNPKELGLQVGDEVRVWAVAEDNRYTPKGNSILEAKLSPNPNVSQSNVKTFSIVPPQPGKEENPTDKPKESPEKPDQENKTGNDDSSTKPKRSDKNPKPNEEKDPSKGDEKNDSKTGDKGKSKTPNKEGSKNKPDNNKSKTGDESKSPMNNKDEEKSDENKSDTGDSESGKDDPSKNDESKSDESKSDEQKNDENKKSKSRNDRNKSKANENDEKSGGSGGSGGESSEEEKKSDEGGKSKQQGGGSAGDNSESTSDDASNEAGESGTKAGSNSKPKSSNKQGSGDDGGNEGAGDSSKQSQGGTGGNKSKGGGQRSNEAGSENGEESDEDPSGAPESDGSNQQEGNGKGKPSQKKLHAGEVIEKALQHKKESEGRDPAQPPGQQEKPSGDSAGNESNGTEGEPTQPKSDAQGGGEGGEEKGKGAAKSSSGSGGAGKEEQGKDADKTAEGGATKPKNGENAGKGSSPKEGNGKLDKTSKANDASGGQQSKPNDPSTEPEVDPNAPDKTEGSGDPGTEGSGNSDSSKENSPGGGQGQKANSDRKKEPDKGAKSPQGSDPGGVSQSKRQSDSKGGQSGDESGGGGKGSGQPGKQKGNDGPGTQSAGDSGEGAANQEGSGEDSDKAGTQKQAPGKTGKSSDKAGDGSSKKPDASGKTPGEGSTDGNNSSATSKKAADAQSKQGKGPVTGGGAPSDGAVDNSLPPSGPKGEVPEGDEANEAYAKKATDLALKHLRDQQDNPDPELLKELNFTKDELRAFLDRWDAMKKAAERSPEAAERLDEAYKSLGIRPASDKRRGAGTRTDNMRDLRDSGGRSDPPSSYADQFRSFRKGAQSGSGNKPASGSK